MLNFLKKKTETPEVKSTGFFTRLKDGLAKTRAGFTSGMANLILGKKTLDAELVEEIETLLLTADVGVETTQALIDALTQKMARKELNDPKAALHFLQQEMQQVLQPCEQSLALSSEIKPFVILVVGVNGSGKTTTIGKLAHYFQQQGKSILLAAGDTFRAAAVQQLQQWGERNSVPVVAQQPGADTAAVIYDAVTAAKARQIDVVIADTAGRLHTQAHLMAELQKIKRVLVKFDPSAPHEVLLVLDATIGQNALVQAQQFHQAMGVTGIVLTKLDGTAKGGIIFAIAKQLPIPIRFIGLGEAIADLRSFQAGDFVRALFEA